MLLLLLFFPFVFPSAVLDWVISITLPLSRSFICFSVSFILFIVSRLVFILAIELSVFDWFIFCNF